jgi:hypothetical protein
MCVSEMVEATDNNYAVDVHADTLQPWTIKTLALISVIFGT